MPTVAPFPSKDADFNNYLNIAVPYLNTNKTRLRVNDADLLHLNTLYGPAGVPPGAAPAPAVDNWKTIYPQVTNKDAVTSALRNKKDALRTEIQKTMRTIFGDIPKSALTADDRAALNLKARDLKPTPINPVDFAPIISIKKIIHEEQVLEFQNPETPHSHKMPKGNKVELQRAISIPKVDPGIFTTYKITGKFITKVMFGDENTGNTVSYRACYVTNRGARGPFSVVVSSVIA